MEQLHIERQGSNDIWVVHNGKSNNYWYVQRMSRFNWSVDSVYYRADGLGKQQCRRTLTSGKTRTRIIHKILATI